MSSLTALSAGEARAFDLLEWRTDAQLVPHALFSAGQRAGLCAAPLDEGDQDAFLRWALLRRGAPMRLFHELVDAQAARLAALAVRAWWCVDVRGSWLIHALRERRFRRVDEIITFELDGAAAVESAASAALSIAPVEPRHLERIAAIDARAFDSAWRYPAFVLAAARQQLSVFTLASVDGEPLGYVAALLQGGAAHVVRLAVDPLHRRCGIGTALLVDAVDRLRALGAGRITLNTLASLPADRLYRRVGFRPLRVGVDVLRLDLEPR